MTSIRKSCWARCRATCWKLTRAHFLLKQSLVWEVIANGRFRLLMSPFGPGRVRFNGGISTRKDLVTQFRYRIQDFVTFPAVAADTKGIIASNIVSSYIDVQVKTLHNILPQNTPGYRHATIFQIHACCIHRPGPLGEKKISNCAAKKKPTP